MTNIEITTFNEAYDALTLAFPDPSERGKEFEHYVKWWFLTDPRFDFTDVWLWGEWPDAWKTTEAGIDVIAKRANGDLWAIQSKDYITNVIRDEVDRFVTESGRVGPDGKSHLFARRIFITTADSVSFHVDDLVTGPLPALPELVIWCRNELEKAPVSWPTSPDELHTPIPQPEPKTPWDYQELALAKIADGFIKQNRGQLIMACGTGKTVTGVWATKDLKAQFVAVFVPNLGLLDQTFTDWKLNQVQFEALIVGSDKSVGYDDVVSSVSQLVQRATTDVEDIKAFALKDSLLPKVIFSTYQSSLVVGEALNQTGMTLDLAIIDEAHRTAGKVGNEFTAVLDDAKVPAAKRLFMTGTAKTYSPRVLKGGAERGV
ncbi:MAG: DEAD/DEAH box helicase family protein [Mycobacterium sp.]|uniref:restriction endonuclease n=1 Tax=Mycobacterium sp. TaxID=1785 RepID=UPI003F9785C2